MYITSQMLRDANACKDQVLDFENEWPNGAEVNRAGLERAVELGLDINWFASYFLPLEAQKAYRDAEDTARRMYMETVNSPSLDTYFQSIVTALLEAIECSSHDKC